MRAAVVERYGPPEVAQVREVAAPGAGKGQVLVRVHAVAVTSTHVIDHTVTPLADVTERFDCVGNVDIAGGRRLLAPGGRLLLAVADLGQTIRARGDVVAGPGKERAADSAHLLGLVASGDLRVVVSRTLALGDIAEAHRVVDSGRKVGNLVLTM